MVELAQSKGRIIVIDDERGRAEAEATALRKLGYVASTSNIEHALERQREDLAEVAVCHLDGQGLALTRRLTEAGVPVVLTAQELNTEQAVAALRSGARDLVTEPVEEGLLVEALERLCGGLRRDTQRLEWIGESPAMQQLAGIVARVARGDAPVFLCGESGTGKELVANAIHVGGPRHDAPFVAVNCAAVPGSLLESELFGHTRGAFTDARSERRGLFSQANGGTLFLDEIGELPLELQPKLLRALQERKVRPLGSTREIAFDARLITATNSDLELAVREHRFREDLFYRINVVRIDLPPLRDRRSDVLPLAERFLARAATRTGRTVSKLSEAAADRLLAWSWPGNVRELENCMESAVAMAHTDEIQLEDLPARLRESTAVESALPASRIDQLVTLEELNHRYLHRVLRTLSGNKTKTAEVLGIDRRTLYRMLARETAPPPPPP